MRLLLICISLAVILSCSSTMRPKEVERFKLYTLRITSDSLTIWILGRNSEHLGEGVGDTVLNFLADADDPNCICLTRFGAPHWGPVRAVLYERTGPLLDVLRADPVEACRVTLVANYECACLCGCNECSIYWTR